MDGRCRSRLGSVGLTPLAAQATQKPPLHARHWIAITGKPLGATAGALMFAKGGNAVDAACAMLGAVTTMWDVLSWGGETQALIYHPKLKQGHRNQCAGCSPVGCDTPSSTVRAATTILRSTAPWRRSLPALRADCSPCSPSTARSLWRRCWRPQSRWLTDIRSKPRPPTTSRARRTRSSSGSTRVPCFCPMQVLNGRRPRRERSSSSGISPPRCGSWSRQSGRR